MSNTIREDVVSISFDVKDNPFADLTANMDDLRKAVTGGVDDSTEELKRLAKGADKATDGMDDLTKTTKDLAKTKISGVADDLNDAAKQANKGDKETKSLLSKLKDAARVGFDKTIHGLKSITTYAGKAAVAVGKVFVKSVIGATAAAGVAIGGIVTKSVSAYAEYEQLIGGVETLFKGSAPQVEKYANDAYKTAGLSANQYMETVTSFSASLLQSLGGDTNKAAKYADMAIIDMADNANKMGSDMTSIQDAYQGFAKQNYTMLDNLKLGYGGTKEEMQRLVKDAAKVDKSIDANSLSYANIVKAIHVVQEEMGIAGTTSKEAANTISGSLSSMKSAWGNLLPSLIKGGDSFDQCVKNLVSSVKTFAKNIKPAIKSALEGVGSLIEELTPVIVAEIPTIVDELLPPLIKAAVAVVAGLIKALPSIIGTLIKELPNLVKMIGQAILEAFGNNPILGKIGSFIAESAGKIAKLIPVVLGLGAAFKVFSVVTSIFGKSSSGGGGLFGGITKTFKELSATKPVTILKGLANLAIIISGLTALAAGIMFLAPHMAKLTDAQSLLEVIVVIGVLGIVGAGLSKLAGSVGNIPVATVAKGLANIGIIVAGMSALYLLVGAVSLLSFDFKKMLQIVSIMGVLGAVGGALSVFAGIAGLIPVPVVLLGLANMALVLAGISALVVAFGALTKIKGFTEFIDSGGKVLVKLCNIIGEMAGAIIGGIGVGVSNALPKIGENIAAFGTSLKPFFAAVQGADLSGIGDFFGTIGKFMLTLAANDILSFFTGGTDLVSFGNELTSFATSAQGFFTTVATYPANGFTNAAALFKSLADIGNVPNTGGIKQWFTGTNNFEALADGLSQLSSSRVTGFYNTVATLPAEGFNKAKELFQSIADIGNVPNTGGIKQWFTGTNDFEALATGLSQLSGGRVTGFFTTVAALPQEGFTKAKQLFQSLSDIGNIPNTGGVAQWFSGKNDFAGLAAKLPPFGTAMATFYASISSIDDFTRISKLFTALKDIGEAIPNSGGLGQLFTGKNDFASLGASIKQFGIDIKDFLTQINSFDASKLTNLWNALNKAGTVTADLSSVVEKNMQGMLDTVETYCGKMEKVVSDTTADISKKVKGTDLTSSGKFMMSGLVSGMNSMKATVLSTARSIAASAAKAINAALDINSPSKLTTESGEYTGEGLVVGMQNMKGKVTKAAEGLSTTIAANVEPSISPYTPSSSTVSNTNNSHVTNNFNPQFTLNMNGASATESNKRQVKQWIKESIDETFASMARTNPELSEV